MQGLKKELLMMIGQDKSTYHPFIFSKKHWKGPACHTFIVPKSVGEILMISGFQLREFGLGLRAMLNTKIMTVINDRQR